MTPFEQTILHQNQAADPSISAWVGANAGSGKTRVLTNRVARLLLGGADPSRILCITYTKAAAAEMGERLFDLLGEWALMGDDALTQKLRELEGNKATPRTGAQLSGARQLFARALETPGGLKIQTIHAFCAQVLRRFPIEAGVPPGFHELDEGEATALVQRAIVQTIHLTRNHLKENVQEKDQRVALNQAFMHLCNRYGAQKLPEMIQSYIRERHKIEFCSQSFDGDDPMIEAFASAHGLTPGLTQHDIIETTLAHINMTQMMSIAEALSAGGKIAQENSILIAQAAQMKEPEAIYNKLLSFFLTQEGEKRVRLTDAKVRKSYPDLETQLFTLQDIFFEAREKCRSLAIYVDTKHWLLWGRFVWEQYEKLKWSQGALDFDDLVMRTKYLFAHGAAATQWVMYKLDHGLEHILIDEAQDTSPGQWDVIERPLEEFIAGEGAREKHRSFFVVGDEKQSIYSFQGADTALFNEKRSDIGKKIESVSPFREIPLTLSFRSTAPVLQFVDAAFAQRAVIEGLGDVIPLTHQVHRIADAGVVEVWPQTPKPDKVKALPWDTPVDQKPEENPERLLCDTIAEKISGWLSEEGEVLPSQQRKIVAGDIIILVQSRGGLFYQMIKSLTQCEVPVAGADRLKPLDDIAVQDLLSYGRWALMPEDDLSLGEILKSPLFGFDDEDLFALSYQRKTSLWMALRKRQGERKKWKHAVEEMQAARKIALHQGAYDFYSSVLDTENRARNVKTGRQRFYGRLGRACEDILDAFMAQSLEFEAKNPRNLQGFISWFEQNDGDIKRELDQESHAVRIMTIHGVKGLEGNIVFLLDAHRKPNLNNKQSLFYVDHDDDSLSQRGFRKIPIISESKESHNLSIQAAKTENKRLAYEEYRRLFYVAATRARDRLYVCGIETSKPKKDEDFNCDHWHQLSQDAMVHLKETGAEIESLSGFPWEGSGYRLQCEQIGTPESEKVPMNDVAQIPDANGKVDNHNEHLDWLFCDCADEKPIERLSPSTLADRFEDEFKEEVIVPGGDTPWSGEQLSAELPTGLSPVQSMDRYARGNTLHRLLEILPDHPVEEQRRAGLYLLEKLQPGLNEETKNAWCDEVLKVLRDENFSQIFAPGSQAEVKIGGTPKGAKKDIIINGQIDRLRVTQNEVLVVDYKTNQPPPKTEQDVAQAYLAQMAAYRALLGEIYPDKPIKAALLWTYEARLMLLSDDILDHAFASSLM